MVLAATDAVCCHNTLTSTKTAATKISARATCDTGREGKRLTSFSEPDSSISSCHPGNVARRRKQAKARMMATILWPTLSAIVVCHVANATNKGEEKSGNPHQIRKYDIILECTPNPDQIQRILIYRNLSSQCRCIVAAQETAPVGIDADAEIADPNFQLRTAYYVCDGGRDTRIDLSGIVGRRIGLVEEGDEEDVGDEG